MYFFLCDMNVLIYRSVLQIPHIATVPLQEAPNMDIL